MSDKPIMVTGPVTTETLNEIINRVRREERQRVYDAMQKELCDHCRGDSIHYETKAVQDKHQNWIHLSIPVYSGPQYVDCDAVIVHTLRS